MRKLGKVKLNQFSKDELDQRKMNALMGGCRCYYTGSCGCSCSSTPGISHEEANELASSAASGAQSTGMQYVYAY